MTDKLAKKAAALIQKDKEIALLKLRVRMFQEQRDNAIISNVGSQRLLRACRSNYQHWKELDQTLKDIRKYVDTGLERAPGTIEVLVKALELLRDEADLSFEKRVAVLNALMFEKSRRQP